MIRLIVHGARGRMGRRIRSLARDDARFKVVASLGRDDRIETPEGDREGCDVIVDFSSPSGAERAARLLVGTTGLPRRILDVLDDAARSVPVMIAPNTSRGVVVLNHLAAEAARLLGGEFDVDVIETHHARKRDAPSGTAVNLVRIMRENADLNVGPQRVHSIRAGDVRGEHTVCFSGRDEQLKIFHSVASRDVFAAGALHAAAWLHGQPAGHYTVGRAYGLA
jgi:4-hydroxy-tetrahydrodipicolinate reductase